MLQATLAEQEKVAKRTRACRLQTLSELDKVIALVQESADRIRPKAVDRMAIDGESSIEATDMDTEEGRDIAVECSKEDMTKELTLLQKRIKPSLSKVIANHKEGYTAISKLSKTVDKALQTNLEQVSNPTAFQGKEHLLDEVVVQHLLREGHFDIAEALVKEGNINVGLTDQESFKDMYHVLEALKARDLDPALLWVERHRDKLEVIGSDLDFLLHRLQLIGLIADDKWDEALEYSRRHMPKFASNHLKDIQHVMGAFAYRDRLETSPYSHLLGDSHWLDIVPAFTTTSCRVLGLPVQSSLHVGVTVGARALPTVLKMANVMQNKREGLWSQKDELPVEVFLGKEHQYHSVFACPVSREQTTPSNPPMLLVCGHAIAKQSLKNIVKGTKVKCPYCPSEQTLSQAIELHI